VCGWQVHHEVALWGPGDRERLGYYVFGVLPRRTAPHGVGEHIAVVGVEQRLEARSSALVTKLPPQAAPFHGRLAFRPYVSEPQLILTCRRTCLLARQRMEVGYLVTSPHICGWDPSERSIPRSDPSRTA
jgi:hypothetical protein